MPALPVSVLLSGVAGGVDVAGAGERQVLDVGAERVADAGLHRVGAFACSFRHGIAGRVDDIGVVAGTASHGVVAGAAAEHVVAGVADEGVVEAVAGGVDGAGAGERQVLDVGAQRVADAGLHRVGAFAGGFRHRVARRIHHVNVVAGAADHGVAAGAAAEHVVAGVADEGVVERIAGGVDVAGAGERQVLDVGSQRVADAGLHRVGARAGRFRHRVAGRVHHVGIIAGAAAHGVVASPAVEHVVAGVADERVVERVAGGVDGRSAGQRQILHVGAERVTDARLYRVGAFTCSFRHGIACRIDDIGVIAGAAAEHVVGAVPDERVVEGVAGGVDGFGPGERQVLHVGAQGIADAGLHRVGAGIGCLGDRIAGRVDDIRVVAGTASHAVIAGAAVKHVVAAVPGERVVEGVAGGVDGAGAGERQVLHVGAEGVADARLYRVGAGIGCLGDRIAGRVDDIRVVAGTASHGVIAGAAAEHVIAAVPGQRVVEDVAGGVDGAGASQRQILDVGAQRVADTRLHRVGAFACSFRHGIPGRIHHIGVIAGTAAQGVVAGAAV